VLYLGNTRNKCVQPGEGQNPLLYALSTVYGKKIEKKNCVFSGGTERSIIRDLLIANGIEYKDVPEEWNKINPLYKDMLGRIIENGDVEYKALPNVNQLLAKCAESPDFDLALVTGNLAHCAELKLKSAGIDADLFKRTHNGERKLIGGFGEDDIYRPGLVSTAMRRFNEIYSDELDPRQFLVIGDTPKDVHCGHVNRVPAMAVATGIFGRDSLAKVADSVVQDFSDIDATLQALRNTKLRDISDINYEIPPDKSE